MISSIASTKSLRAMPNVGEELLIQEFSPSIVDDITVETEGKAREIDQIS